MSKASRSGARSPKSKSRALVLGAIDGEIEPIPVQGSYKLGLFFVAAFMILIPVVYVALIVATAIGTYWHAVNNVQLIRSMGFTGGLLYVVPLVGGAVLVPFMIKPIFSRPAFSQPPKRLRRETQPLVYEYVDRLCDAVHAPRPTSVRIVCDVNASAGFRHGLVSLFNGEVVLTLGLPLVKGMTLRQLSGVLAHEFGHFTQGTARRFHYVIVNVNGWLHRAAYERDSWDLQLYRLSKEGDVRLWPIVYTMRFFVWAQRQVVHWLLRVGALVSFYLSREMEFDADRYSARAVGVETIRELLRKVLELSAAHEIAMGDIHQFASEGRLCDDLPSLIAANAESLTPEMRRTLRRMQREERTGLFDTHPSARDRLRSVREEDTDGIFELPEGREDLPASVLFDGFERVSKAVTKQFYEEQFGLQVKSRDLHSVDDLLARQKAEIEAGKSLHRYFQVRIPALRPLPIAADANERPDDPRATAERLASSRKEMLGLLEEYERLAERYDEAEGALLLALSARSLYEAGHHPDPSEFGLRGAGRKAAGERFEATRGAVSVLAAKMLPFETVAGERLSAALGLLRVDRIAGCIENGTDLQYEVERLVEEAMFVSELMSELPPFRILFRQTSSLYDALGGRNDARLVHSILDRAERIRTRLFSLQRELGDHLYPFDHAKADTTLREWALPYVPEEGQLGELMVMTERMFERLVAVQMRLFARLAAAAEQVETAMGMEPLPDPEEKVQAERRRREAEARKRRRKRRSRTTPPSN